MSKITFILLLLSSICCGVAVAQSEDSIEHRVWDKTPIHIILPVGEERRIDFPLMVTLQVPESIKQLSKRIQVNESGSVYWTAEKSFGKQRVNAITDTGYSYILDVEARPKGHKHPIAIVDDRIPSDQSKNPNTSSSNSYDYDYVDLARFASQNIYAPERLIKPLPGVHRIPVSHDPVDLYRGGDLILEPMAQWKAPTIPTLYVTAVRVASNSLDEITLDPRLLRGDFLAASAQHGFLRPVGSGGSTTAWYLLSAQPFDEVTP